MGFVRTLLGIAVAAYGLLVGGMFLGQRALLFNTYDGGSLAAKGWMAIADSERVEIITADGERLAAWYVAPTSQAAPVFLFFPGQGGQLEWMDERWRRIREAGAGVLAVSYRGYPGSTGRPSEAGLVRDAEAAFAWLLTRHSAKSIVIHGLSLGTGVAVALAAGVDARALILEAPFTAAVDVAAERYGFLPVGWLMRDKFLSRERIAGVRMPILAVHGTDDRVVPFPQAKRLLARAKAPAELVALPGSGHNSLVRDGLYRHVWRFLEALR